MKYLLDTMVWLWSVGETERIGRDGLEVISDGRSEIYLSAVSVWEITIKAKLGKYKLPEAPGPYIRARMAAQHLLPLPITHNHALAVYDLRLHHQDPFDRLLIAQALAEDLVILTSDRVFRHYPAQLLWCGK
jgi:PIN domain nuclease of toxin-antitoxin system